MQKSALYLACILAFAACVDTNATAGGDTVSSKDSTVTVNSPVSTGIITDEPDGDSQVSQSSIDEALFQRLRWIDTLAGIAVKSSDNPLIQYAIRDSSITWMWDGLTATDTACYIILQVGHHIDEEGAPRFATAGWLYVDTLTRAVYEYNIPDERFIKLSIPVVDTLADE